MVIRKAFETELDRIMEIYALARKYMAENGNAEQWGTTHPPREMIVEDIRLGQCFVGICEDGQPHCVFAFLSGVDPTYNVIVDGEWLNDEEYLTIHRIASDGKYHGVFAECMDFCKKKAKNLRIDTHEKNKTMQHVLQKNGFKKCGTIYLEDGRPRIAYQFAVND